MQRKSKMLTYAIIVTCMIIGCCMNLSVQSQESIKSEFSVSINDTKLLCYIEDSVSSILYINRSSNNSEPVTISGSWIGDQQPDQIQVNHTTTTGIPPFTNKITFTSTGKETGIFIYQITASSGSITYHNNITFQVTYNHLLTLETCKETYEKGHQINISGTVSQNPLPDTNLSEHITLTIKQDDFKRSFITPVQNNLYNYTYNISYGDPEGLWNVTAEIRDDQGNNGSQTQNITVTLPSDIVRYKVVWYSPPEDAIYKKGSSFNISIFVTENDIGVSNATTTCTTPSMETIALTEIKQGYYQQSYTIPWDAASGTWTLSVESIKGTGSSLKSGGSNTAITVKPSTLHMDIIEPSDDEYYVDQSIPFIVELSYPDQTIVPEAQVRIETPTKTIYLKHQGNGIYSGECTSDQQKEGNWIIDIIAEDPYENNALAHDVIFFAYEEQNEIPLMTIIGICIVFLIIIVAIFLFRNRLHYLQNRDIESEIEEIKRLQKEAVDKYYKKGSISRNAYNTLQKEYTQRLAELNRNEKNLLKKRFQIVSLLKWNRDST